MDLIIKPTELCNFKCSFCSSTNITDNKSDKLSFDHIRQFIDRYPDLNTIIINGGDPLMLKPSYYFEIIEYLEQKGMDTVTLSFTTNLWAFYKNPDKWTPLFTHPMVRVTTSFQYGGGRLKHDLSEFSESEFLSISDLMLERCGYRPDFISVITTENQGRAIDNVLLAKRLGVECKLNYAMSSGTILWDQKTGHSMGQLGKPFMLSDMYNIYCEIADKGLMRWEYNTKQMVKVLNQHESLTCPLTRSCDDNIRVLQPSGEYYSCGAFGDDREYQINFEQEMSGSKIRPLQNEESLFILKEDCLSCPVFNICNGCKKTIKDLKTNNLVEKHCTKMKTLIPKIIMFNK